MSGAVPGSPLPGLSISSPGDVIGFSMKLAGILGQGQTASGEDLADAFRALNMMLSQWQRKRYLLWALEDTGLTSTGAQSYTVGPGGDYDIPRPDKLRFAYVRQFGAISAPPYETDYKLTIMEAEEDYAAVTLKSLGSFPRWIYYRPDYPLGTVYPWPVPDPAIYEVHLITPMGLQTFKTTSDPILMPPEYEEALTYNLAVRLAPMFGNDAPQEVVAIAKAALATIRSSNAQMPELQLPGGLLRGNLYDIRSDQRY
jgi:hypothetical protein